MEAVHNLRKNITIILIAHRLSTVKNCDKMFFLTKGQLESQGTFDELVNLVIIFEDDENLII